MSSPALPRGIRSYESQVRFGKAAGVVFDALTTLSGLAGWWSPATGSCFSGGQPRLACYEHCSRGWDHFLPSLREYVETGAGRPLLK